MIFAEIALHRFHRGGKEWRQYDWRKHISYFNGPGVPYYSIKPILGTKNSKRKNHKNNRKLQNIIAKKGGRLYKALHELEQKRGGIRTTALFPQPYPEWRVDSLTGKLFGYKDVPIGHNNLVRVFDNLLSRCCSFKNTYTITRQNGRKISKRYYSLYGFRASLITAAASFGLNNDGIACLSQHANPGEIETYIRGSQNTQRSQRAQQQFKDKVFQSMYYYVQSDIYAP